MIIVKNVRNCHKPKNDEIGKIINKVKSLYIGEYKDVSATEVARAVENGHPIIPSELKLDADGRITGKKNVDFKATKWMTFDIDDNMSIKECIDHLNTLGIEPSVLYPSFSHSPSKDKFRVLFKLKQYITDPDVYKYVWSILGHLITKGSQDQACKDLSRMYWGTKYKALIVNDDAVLDLEKIFDTEVITPDKLSDGDFDKYILDNGYCYKCRVVRETKKKAIKKNKKQVEQIRKIFGLSENKEYKKTELMKRFELGEWDEIGGQTVIWKLMHLYITIGDAETFLNTIEKYHSAYISEWEYKLEYSVENGYTPTHSLLNDFKSINLTEKINWTGDVATQNFEVEKYISDAPEGYIKLINDAQVGKKGLLISPTGSGKTYSVVRHCKDNDIKAVFIVPNSSTVEQIMTRYDVYGAYGDKSLVDAAKKSNNIIACTWDKVKQLKNTDMSDYIYILDEVHQAYTDLYRKEALMTMFNLLNKFKGGIDITATPKRIPMEYDSIIEYKQKVKTKYNVMIYNKSNAYDMAINIINKGKKSALFLDDKTKLEYITTKINKNGCQIDADNKADSPIYKSIIEDESIGNTEVLLNTSVLVASVNIKDKDITDIIIMGIKDVAHIKQYVARFRDLKECNVHIFVNDPEELSDTYNIENFVQKKIDDAEKEVNLKNELYYLTGDIIALGSNTLKMNLSKDIYYDKIDDIYKVDKLSIRGCLYNAYYQSRTVEQLKVLLEEYFPNICITHIDSTEIDETLKELKESRKFTKGQALEFLKEHKEYLVGYEYISKNAEKPYKLQQYMLENNLSLSVEILKEKGILDAIKTGKVGDIVTRFSKKVLDFNFSLDLAWAVVNMHHNKAKNFEDKIEIIAHRFVLEKDSYVVKKTMNTDIYDYLIKRLPVGSEYSEASIIEFTEELIQMGHKSLNTKLLKDFINNMYKTKRVSKRIGDKIKKVNVIDDLWSIEDIKKDLSLHTHDKSLENVIALKVYNYISQFEIRESQTFDIYDIA